MTHLRLLIATCAIGVFWIWFFLVYSVVKFGFSINAAMFTTFAIPLTIMFALLARRDWYYEDYKRRKVNAPDNQ